MTPTLTPTEDAPLVVVGSAGASFRLAEASPVDASVELPGKWLVETTAGSTALVVRTTEQQDTYDAAFEAALDSGQAGLDLLAFRGTATLVMAKADSSHAVWWTEPRGRCLRVFDLGEFGATVSATAEVRDRHGNLVPQPLPPTLSWHPSFRYFRLSQATSDLFDSYRNMYLALESVLSAKLPQRGGEGERRWLVRTITEAGKQLELTPYAPEGANNVVDAIVDDLYLATRTAISHAKAGRSVLLPHSERDRRRVGESLRRLSYLYLDLAAAWLDARKPRSGLSNHGFDVATGFDAAIAVTDDGSPLDRADVAINPMNGVTVRLPTRVASELGIPGLKFWFGERDAALVRSAGLSVVRRIGLLSADALIAAGVLDRPLSLEGLDVLQVQLGFHLVNRDNPRLRFPM